MNLLRLALLALALPGRLLIRAIDDLKRANGVPPLGRFLRGCVHGFLGLFVLMACAAPAASPSTSVTATTSAPRATYSPPVTMTPTVPVIPDGTITDGTYEIGVDVAPGKYKTSGPADTRYWPMCYWARLKDTTGDHGTIIANDNIKGQTTVTIKDSDGAFETSGCAPWVKVG